MRYAKWTLLMAVLILAASAAYAECPCGSVAPACPAPCPAAVQCPAPCPAPACPAPTCPSAACTVCPPVCPCPAAVPAAIGAGPCSCLQGLQCPNFDPAYAQAMFADYSTIIAVTQYGAGRAIDHNLRDISGEINGYLTSGSNKLQVWFGTISCGSRLQPCCDKAQAIIAQLAASR